MFITTLRQGAVALDAYQAGNSPPTTPVQVLTDDFLANPQENNNWQTIFQWSAESNVGTLMLADAGTANPNGPQILCLDRNAPTGGAWVVGRLGGTLPPNWSSSWIVSAAGSAAAGLTSLPVYLMQNLGGPWQYLSAQVPPANQAPTTSPAALTAGATWMLVPNAPPQPNWLQFQVPALQDVTVEVILSQIWNRLVGSRWADALTPGILTWMYDYPNWYPNQPTQWQADIDMYLGPTIFSPYFLLNEPGFGVGEPPPIVPLPPR